MVPYGVTNCVLVIYSLLECPPLIALDNKIIQLGDVVCYQAGYSVMCGRIDEKWWLLCCIVIRETLITE